MHFTVHVSGSQNYEEDFSYRLAFIPCPVWIKGDKQILNLNPERPDYCLGSIKKLIYKERPADRIADNRTAYIIVHQTGHGSPQDLSTLKEDLQLEGFKVVVCGG